MAPKNDKSVKKTIPTPYRSNLQAVVTELNKLNLRTHHLEMLKRTPFWHIIDCVLNRKVDLDNCRKNDKDVTEIIRCYDKELGVFVIGDKKIKLMQDDVRLIFGIQDGNMKMHIGSTSNTTSDFVLRCFFGTKRLTKTLISKKLEEVVSKDTEIDVEDVARLITLFILVSMLVPTKSLTISWLYTIYVDKLDEICTFNWSDNILEALISSLNTNTDGHSGCVLLLPYWLCEHTTLVQPKNQDAFPRFLKWDLKELQKCMRNTKIQSLNNKYIVREKLQYTEVEKLLLQQVLLEANTEEGTINDEVLQIIEEGNKSNDEDLPINEEVATILEDLANSAIDKVIMELQHLAPLNAAENERHIDDVFPATTEDFVADNTKMTRKVEDLKKLVANLNEELINQEVVNKTLQFVQFSTIFEMQKELDAYRAQGDSLNAELIELKQKDNTSRKRILKEELDAVRAQVEAIKKEISELMIREFTSVNERLQKEFDACRKQVVDLKNEIINMKKSEDTLHDSLQEELDASKAQVELLKKDVKGMNNSLVEYFVEYKKLKNKNEELEEEIRKMKEVNKLLNEQIEEGKVAKQAQPTKKGQKRTVSGQSKNKTP